MLHIHCVKSVQMRSFLWSVFPLFRLNTEICGVNLCIQFKYRKIRVSKTSYLDTFHGVFTFQCRKEGPSVQRIKNGNIIMALEFKNKESRDRVTDVVVKVKRTYESRLKPEKRVGEITIPFQDNKRPQPIQDKQVFSEIFDCENIG